MGIGSTERASTVAVALVHDEGGVSGISAAAGGDAEDGATWADGRCCPCLRM
jgi:hypothetical protein